MTFNHNDHYYKINDTYRQFYVIQVSDTKTKFEMRELISLFDSMAKNFRKCSKEEELTLQIAGVLD